METLSRNLIGDMPIDVFDRDVREQRSMHFPEAFREEVVADLFSISRLDDLLFQRVVASDHVDIIANRFPKSLAQIQHLPGPSDPAIVADAVLKGATIRVRQLQNIDGRVAKFCQSVQRLFAASSQVNLYLTPPFQTAFEAHFDTTDIFILQCDGEKEWHLYEDYSEKVDLPLLETPWDPLRYRPGDKYELVMLRPGDSLYIPRGVMHGAACRDRESMHLTISLAPLTLAEVFISEINRLAVTNSTLRTRIPWAVSQNDEEIAGIGNWMRESLQSLATEANFTEAVLKKKRAFSGEDNPQKHGQLRAAITNLVKSQTRRAE